MTDEQIILLYQQRNENAIAETSKKHGAVCRKIAGNILDNEQDIDECVSDVLFRVWNSIPPENPSNLAAFLTIVTRNAALDKWRRNNRRKRGGGQVELLLDELSDCIHTSEELEETIDKQMLVKSVNHFIRALPDDTRKIFVLRYYSLMSIKEIAYRNECSESKIKSILMRTRKKLRKYLKQEEWI